jgi:O-antigen/teichoic acid export membrane protein
MNSANAAVRLVRNTLINGAGSVAGILVGLVLTPFMIDRLGLTAYGIWSLALTLTFSGGYAALADLGVEGAAVRYIAEATAEEDLDAVSRTVSTTLLVLCVIACLAAPAAVALAHPLVSLFGISNRLRPAAELCFALVGAQLAFELPARAFVAVLHGTQRYVTFQAVELVRTLLQAALYVFVLLEGWGVGALGGALMASSLCMLVTYWQLARRAVPGMRVNPLHVRRAELRRVVRFGGGLFALRLVSTIYHQMDKVIIGIALGSGPVGLYEIANKVNLAAATMSSVSVSAVVPAAAFARRQVAVVRDMFVRGSCYAAAASLPFAVAAFIFAKPLLVSWIGPRAEPAVEAARLFLVYEVFQSVQNVGSTMAYGLGHIRVPLLVNGAATLANLGLSIVLVHSLGFTGVIVGTLISNGVAWPVLLGYYLHVFETPLVVWLRRILRPSLVGLLAQVAVSLPLLALTADTRSLPLVVAVSTVSLVSSLAAFVLAGVRGEDRRALLLTVARALGRRPAVSRDADLEVLRRSA